MVKNLKVRSVVIDWQDKTMEIKTVENEIVSLPLTRKIKVTMMGYPNEELKEMFAGRLNDYMMKGYIIQKIEYDE